MNVEQLDGFFAALISGPESEDERVQPERLRSSIFQILSCTSVGFWAQMASPKLAASSRALLRFFQTC